ncbi:sialidase family protein [Vibrio sinaloensis]|nr:sialidase family protein [Vibrio sinaloensis]
MKTSFIDYGLLACTMFTLPLQAQAVAPNVRDVVVFKGGEGGSSHFRIPSIVVAKDGSLVAFC